MSGKVDSAMKLTGILTTWAMNFFAAFAPFGVGDARQPVPVKEVVDCHHVNYFVSEAGFCGGLSARN